MPKNTSASTPGPPNCHRGVPGEPGTCNARQAAGRALNDEGWGQRRVAPYSLRFDRKPCCNRIYHAEIAGAICSSRSLPRGGSTVATALAYRTGGYHNRADATGAHRRRPAGRSIVVRGDDGPRGDDRRPMRGLARWFARAQVSATVRPRRSPHVAIARRYEEV